MVRRSKNVDWQAGEWEIVYGRMAQFETPEESLKRELEEEVGLEVKIGEIISVWHIYRENIKDDEHELVGITFRCQASSDKVRLSHEHSEHKWVEVDEALDLIKVEGIRKDLMKYKKRFK